MAPQRRVRLITALASIVAIALAGCSSASPEANGGEEPQTITLAFGPANDVLESGVEALYWVATDPSLDGVTGEFFNGMTPARAKDEAYHEDLQQRLWDASVGLTSPTNTAA